jgi:hypothetical protein
VIININVDIGLNIIVDGIVVENVEIVDRLCDEVVDFLSGFVFKVEIFEVFIIF